MSSFDALQLSGYPPYYPRSDFWADLGLKPYFEHENGAVHLVIAQIRTCTCCADFNLKTSFFFILFLMK